LAFLSHGSEEDEVDEAVEEDVEAVAGGMEDEGDTEDLVAQDKTVLFMTGPHSEAVPKLAVLDI